MIQRTNSSSTTTNTSPLLYLCACICFVFLFVIYSLTQRHTCDPSTYYMQLGEDQISTTWIYMCSFGSGSCCLEVVVVVHLGDCFDRADLSSKAFQPWLFHLSVCINIYMPRTTLSMWFHSLIQQSVIWERFIAISSRSSNHIEESLICIRNSWSITALI